MKKLSKRQRLWQFFFPVFRCPMPRSQGRALHVLRSCPSRSWSSSSRRARSEVRFPVRCRYFPRDNWWNLDISAAPVDPASASYISFIGRTRDDAFRFRRGRVARKRENVWVSRMPWSTVRSCSNPFDSVFRRERRRRSLDISAFRFIRFPTRPSRKRMIEGREPGNVDLRSLDDRHLLLVDRDRRICMNYSMSFTTARTGTGAWAPPSTRHERSRGPEGWTSADAAGLAILPGLVRYDEAFGTEEIGTRFGDGACDQWLCVSRIAPGGINCGGIADGRQATAKPTTIFQGSGRSCNEFFGRCSDTA